MPFMDKPGAGGFLPGPDTRTVPDQEDTTLTDVAKVGTVVGVGAGLLFAPLPTLGAMTVGGGGAILADPEGAEAAFRTENTIGSLISDTSGKYSGAIDEGYDPFDDVAGTEFQSHWERFSYSRSPEHTELIKQDIIRERKDREYLQSQGWLGQVQSMAAGLFDLPSLLPGGAAVRTAKGVSKLRTAMKVGGYGFAGASVSEAALHATQELRTREESQMNIAGATILSGLLGYGMGARMGRAERQALGKRIEQDFTPPDRSKATPAAETRPSIPREMDALETELRQVHELINPHDDSIALQLQDELIKIDPEVATRDEIYAIKDDGGDFGFPVRERIEDGGGAPARELSPETGEAVQGTRDVPAGGRPTEAVASGDIGATPKGGPKPVTGTETFKIEGFTGVRTAEVPAKGKIASRVYRVYPEGVKVNRIKAPGKSLGKALGRVKISQHPDGRWEVGDVEIGKGIRRQKVASRLYDQIEADLGIKLQPSGWLLNDGLAFWNYRNSGAVKNHRFSKANGHHLSPKQIRVQLDRVKQAIGKRDYLDQEHFEALAKERDELQSLWDGLPAEVTTKPALDQMFALRAYHGSPHDFDKFDVSMVGTGEGAQAFGHGLYFAENVGTANYYREKLTYLPAKERVPAREYTEAQLRKMAASEADEARQDNLLYFADKMKAGESFLDVVRHVPEDPLTHTFGDDFIANKAGNIYEVKIDVEPEQLLDWDLPLREQSDSVKAALAKTSWGDAYANSSLSGGQIVPRTEAGARQLREAGIPGIRYLDQLSRDMGDGTRNVVIFDDSLVKITKKNGEPVTAEERQGVVDQMYALRGFYSPALRAAENITMKKGTGEQFWKQITKTPSVRKDELEWMGLEEFLKDKKSITKGEVLEFMRAHQIELDEVELGGKAATKLISDEKFKFDNKSGRLATFDADGEQLRYFIMKFERNDLTLYQSYRWDNKAVLEGPFTSYDQALHVAQGDAATFAKRTTAPKFSEFGIPGGENYRELLIRFPELESQYRSKHYHDQEIVHIRVDDRVGNSFEKILFINEVQSDLHQKGRRKGYSKNPAEERRQRYADLHEERAAVEARMDEHVGRGEEIPKELVDRNIAIDKEIDRIQRGEEKVVDAPFKGDLWLELALKRALLYAAENGYDAVSWARSDQIAKAVGGDAKALSVQYDQKIGRLLSKYTKKWGGKVDKQGGVADESISLKPQEILERLPESDIAKVRATANERGITGDLSNLRPRLIAQLMDEAGIDSSIAYASNSILHITPEMRSSVMEGQPMAMRRDPKGEMVAEAKFEPEKQLITISRAALDPVNALHHEAVHALKSRGLFTPAEWNVLSDAAKVKGWLDAPEIRDYESVYGRSLEDESIVEEAIALAFQRHVKGVEVQKGAMAQIFERIKAYLERVANYVRSRGYNTAEDIFRAIEQGDVGARAAPARRTDAMAPGMHSAGAKAAQEGDVRLKGALGTEKALKFLSPGMRLQDSPSRAARAWVAELAETSLTYEDHKSWIATARGGAEIGQPGSVETRVKLYDTNIAAGFQALDDLFVKYRRGIAKRMTGDLTVMSMKDATIGTPEGKMNYRQFREEVSASMRRGDEHDIPEVAEAAKVLRKEVFDPLLQRAIELELLPKDVTPETAASYLNRIYNKERIIAERDEFQDVIVKWLQETEINNAQVRGRVSPLIEERHNLSGKIAKLKKKIDRSAILADKVDAAQAEAARMNFFAYKRAVKLSEPIDALRTDLDVFARNIQTSLDDLMAHVASLQPQGRQSLDSTMLDGDVEALSTSLAEIHHQAELADAVEATDMIEKRITSIAKNFRDVINADHLTPHAARQSPEGKSLKALEEARRALGRRVRPYRQELTRLRREQAAFDKASKRRYSGPPLMPEDVDTLVGFWNYIREIDKMPTPERLTSWIVRMGGVEDKGGDILSMIGRYRDRPGLIRKGPQDLGPGLGFEADSLGRANALDTMALRAWEEGFFPELTERPTIDQFIDRIGEDLESGTVVRGDDAEYFENFAIAREMEEELYGYGIKPRQFRKETSLRAFLGKKEAGDLGEDADVAGSPGERADEAAIQAELARRLPRAKEGAAFETEARQRSKTLADQAMGKRSAVSSLMDELEQRQARLDAVNTAIEAEINAWRGKSADAAQSAIKRRDIAEAARTPEQREKQPRLKQADREVLRAARRIAASTEKEAVELVDTASQIIDRILGTPEGRLPYDAAMNSTANRNFGGVAMDARGPLATRQFMIPDARIERWLENDVDLLIRAYVHTMAPDVELTARFGSPDMVTQFKQIAEEYAKMSAATDDPKVRKRLHKRKTEDFLNMGAIRDRIRGTYMLPTEPDSWHVRAVRGMLTWNYMRMLGGMTISAIPDVSRFIHYHGVMGTVGDGIVPLFRNIRKYKAAGDETKWLSGALEMITDNRAMRIADITDTFGRHSKFERGIQSAGRQFGMVSLMAPWNAVMKQLAGTITQTRILRGAERLVAGKPLKQREIEYFADLGISEGALRQIGEQFKKHGHKESNIWSANTAQWDDGMRPVIEALRVGLRKEVDRIIVTPSFGERPRFASSLFGTVILQFKSFAISATQKMLVSGLQQRDLRVLNAAIMGMALGGLVHILKGKISGREVEVDWDDEQSVRQFMGNAFDRSGYGGVLMEANNVAEKVTDGRVGLSALTGKPVSRYASRNVTASLLGPGFGLAEDSFSALNSALGTKDWTQRDTHNVRQLLPYNNLFQMRSIFDNAEQGINEAFGVPEKARR